MADHAGNSAFKFLPVIGKYIVGSLQRNLSQDLLGKWHFPTQFRGEFRDNAFAGDGSRGGPERRELTPGEHSSFNSALCASTRPSKI